MKDSSDESSSSDKDETDDEKSLLKGDSESLQSEGGFLLLRSLLLVLTFH